MKYKVLLFATIMMALAIPQSVKAYDFSYTYQGKTLFYSIEGNGVRVDNPMSDNFYSYVTGGVVIPDSVEYSGTKYAVTAIGSYAFSGCSGLTSVTIGNSVTSIGYQAFYDCTGLSSITIPNSVTTIGIWSFVGCSGLTSVTIGNSVTTINTRAFGDCSSLTSVSIGNSVTTIGSEAFQHCNNLTSITIPNSVISIGSGAFYGCSGLTSIIVESGNTHYDSRGNCNAIIQTDLNLLIQGCQNTIIPNTVISIGNHAFFNCSSLSSVTIPNSVVSIGGHAFYNCSGLTSLTIPNSVTTIGNAAFNNCSGLTSVTIPNSVTTIGEWAFSGCSSLTALTIPNSMTTISNGAFSSCTGLTSVTIPNSVTSIGESAFSGCTGLTSITLPNSVTTIGEDAFYNCSGLTSLNIPNSLTSIGRYAFSFCSGLTSITIPNSVASISEGAFQNCSGLTSVYCKSTIPPTLGDNAFDGNNYQRKIYVPCGSVNTYHNATNWSSYSSKIYDKNYWEHLYNFTVNNDGYGSVSYGELDCDSNITVTANANIGFQLVGWSDGGTGNPRTFHLTGDTTVTALFDFVSYTIIVQPNDVARGFVTGSDTVHYGDTVILSATANYGYHFAQWNDGNTDNPRSVTVTQSAVFTAQFDKNNYTLSVETADSVMGGVNGSNTAEYLDTMTFSATPNYGYHFSVWNDGDTNNPRTITLTQDTAFTALFERNDYIITVLSADTSRGTALGSDTLPYLDSITLSATANYGYHFTRWQDYNTENPRTVVVTQTMTYTAYFAFNQYSITLSVDSAIHGTVSGAGTYNYLTNRIISATANYGYHFVQWSDGNTDNPRTLSLTQDTVLTAFFAPNVYTLTVVSNDETMGTVTAGGSYNYLDTVQIAATVVAAHHHFVQWDDGVTDAVRTVTITSDMAFTAIFAVDTHMVSATVNNDSYGTVTGTGDYPYGAIVNLESVPEEGYYFVKWSNDVTDNPATFTCTGDTTLSAIFSEDVTPNLCMVNVQNNRNVVIWTKELEVVEYKIYREGTTTGNYDLVATVPYNDQSAWVDQGSNPMTRSYRYKMTAMDSWGNESPFSDTHKTMHLRISQGMGTQWNLEWNEYVGAEFITYMIYRGNAWGNLQLIDQMSVGDNTSYTDVNAPAGSVYYQVVVVKSTPCNITKNESIICSNIATNDEVGIADVYTDNVNVYVRDGRIVVDGAEGMEVSVYDMLGRPVPLTVPTAGVYMVRVGNLPARRVVVVR